jgi:hypothetical protein
LQIRWKCDEATYGGPWTLTHRDYGELTGLGYSYFKSKHYDPYTGERSEYWYTYEQRQTTITINALDLLITFNVQTKTGDVVFYPDGVETHYAIPFPGLGWNVLLLDRFFDNNPDSDTIKKDTSTSHHTRAM